MEIVLAWSACLVMCSYVDSYVTFKQEVHKQARFSNDKVHQ